MKLLALGSILAAIASGQAQMGGFLIENFVARHTGEGSYNSLAYFNVAYTDNSGKKSLQDRCYGNNPTSGTNSSTRLGDIAGSCESHSYGWSIQRRPNGHFQFVISYVDSQGIRDFPKTALTTYKSVAPITGTVYRPEQLMPNDAKSFFVDDRNFGK